MRKVIKYNKKIFVVEGVCNAGKTSLITHISRFEKNTLKIPETNTMVKDFPNFPTTYEEARRNEKLILRLEEKKAEIINNAKEQLIFCDRMLPSDIAITFAYSRVLKLDTLDRLFEDIINKISQKSSMFCFSNIIYLEVDKRTVELRNHTKKLTQDWISERLIEEQLLFYKIFNNCMSCYSITSIKVDGLTTEEVYQQVQNIEYRNNLSIDHVELIKCYQKLWTLCKNVGSVQYV